MTFGSPSVGSLRCTGRTAWLERRRKQAGHTLLDDVFPIFMALVELFGEAPADIQARGSLLQHLVPRARAQDQLNAPLVLTVPCHSTDVAKSQMLRLRADPSFTRNTIPIWLMPLCSQVINVENIHSFEQPARTIQYCTPLLILSNARILLWYRFRTGCRVA